MEVASDNKVTVKGVPLLHNADQKLMMGRFSHSFSHRQSFFSPPASLIPSSIFSSSGFPEPVPLSCILFSSPTSSGTSSQSTSPLSAPCRFGLIGNHSFSGALLSLSVGDILGSFRARFFYPWIFQGFRFWNLQKLSESSARAKYPRSGRDPLASKIAEGTPSHPTYVCKSLRLISSLFIHGKCSL